MKDYGSAGADRHGAEHADRPHRRDCAGTCAGEGDLANFDATTPLTCAQMNSTKTGYYITGRDAEKFVSNSTIFLGTVFTGSFLPARSGLDRHLQRRRHRLPLRVRPRLRRRRRSRRTRHRPGRSPHRDRLRPARRARASRPAAAAAVAAAVAAATAATRSCSSPATAASTTTARATVRRAASRSARGGSAERAIATREGGSRCDE